MRRRRRGAYAGYSSSGGRYSSSYGSGSSYSARRRWRIARIALLALAFVCVGVVGIFAARFLATRWVPARHGVALQIVDGHLSDAAISAPAQAAPVLVAFYDQDGRRAQVMPSDADVAAGLPDALESAETGISLADAADALAQLSTLEGAVYDAERSQLLLYGRPGAASFRPDDLRVALQSAYARVDPGVSIDPGPTRGVMPVRYIGPVRGTHFGYVMFEADRRMKTLGLGRDNITQDPVTVNAAGFRTHLQWMQELERDEREAAPQWHRFWFVPKEMRLAVSADGRAARFVNAQLMVSTECLDDQLRPLDRCAAPAANAFAQQLTNQYNELAAQFPVLTNLRELGKLLSLAKWLREANVPVDDAWWDASAAGPVDTPDTTPAMTVNAETSATTANAVLTQTYSLYGGVDFKFDNQYTRDDPVAAEMGQLALAGRGSTASPGWSFSAGDRTWAAAAVSLQPELRPQLPATMTGADLVLGTVDGKPYGLIRRLVSAAKARAAVWQMAVPARLGFGPQAQAMPQENAAPQSVPASLTLRREDGAPAQRFEFRGWTPEGLRVFETTLGQTQLTWSERDGYELRVAFRNAVFDERGRLRALDDDAGLRVRYVYVGDELRRIERSDGAWIDLSYAGGRLSAAESSLGQALRYEYAASGALARVLDGAGSVVARYEYDAAGRVSRELDAQHNARVNNYDGDGTLTSYQAQGLDYAGQESGDGYSITVTSLTQDRAASPANDSVEQRRALEAEIASRLIVAPDERDMLAASLSDLSPGDFMALYQRASGKLTRAVLLDPSEAEFLTADATQQFMAIPDSAQPEIVRYPAGGRELIIEVGIDPGHPGSGDTLAKVVAHGRLQRNANGYTVVSLADTGATLRVLAGEAYGEITAQELETPVDRLERMFSFLPWLKDTAPRTVGDLAVRHPEKFGQLVRERLLTPAGAGIVRLNGPVWVDFRRAFPNQRALVTIGTDSAAIAARLREQKSPLRVQDLGIINGVPTDAAGLANIDKAQDPLAAWQRLHQQISDELQAAGLVAPAPAGTGSEQSKPGAGERALLDALKSRHTVLILVAHSSGETIYLPNGDHFDVGSLTQETMARIKENAPNIVLFSCRTGSIRDGRSLTQALLRAGARSVVAPLENVTGSSATTMLRRFLGDVKAGMSFDDAIDDALKSEGGSQYQILIGKMPPRQDRIPPLS